MKFFHSFPLVVVLLSLSLVPLTTQADTKVRSSSFDYDSTGLLIKETIEPGSPNDCLQISYSYDVYGNKASISTAACAGATDMVIWSASSPRTVSAGYGTDGRFPITTSNALNQSETKQYDPWGAVTSLTGPNGLVTQWEYDGFGRKSKEIRSDGTYSTWTYKLCTDSGADCPGAIGGAASVWVLIEQSFTANGAPLEAQRRQYYDSLRRVIRVQTQGFDGAGTAPAIVQDTEYNTLGQVARKSNLYALGGTAAWTSYTYDILGRVIQEQASDPGASGGIATTSISYNGLSTTTTNSNGQSKTAIKNAQGQIAQVIDTQGNSINYTYDALGQLIQTDAAGSLTVLSYNQRGQKISMQDPAMGAWEYRYNAFGELVWQRDSKSQTVTMDYDQLGRMTQRSEPDLISQWSYDQKFDGTACGKGIGKLCEAKTDNGYKRTHSYDTLGRVSSTATLLDNPTVPATVSVAYDPNTGRISQKTWPTGYQASYQYTPNGYLNQVTGGGSNGFTETVIWQVLAMDAQGHITQYRQGNQVTTVKTYDPSTGRLTNQTATQDGQASGNVLSQTYTYDSLGNLKTKVDDSPGVGIQESFSYDSLNRLNLYTALGGALNPWSVTEILYDSRGNISYKSDVGRYWYDSARPNRLVNITLETGPGAQIANTGTRQLSYAFDDTMQGAQTINGTTMGNGNLMYTVSYDSTNNRHTVRNESYTSFNMPSTIVYGNFITNTSSTADRTLTFVYGPEHQRIKQQVQLNSSAPTSYSAGSTWYLNGVDSQDLTYEKEIKDSGVTEYKHYVSAQGMVFALYVSRTGNLGTQAATSTRYFHHDQLGSLSAISDETGAVIERLAYDPWGKRRNIDGNADTQDSLISVNTKRGYTMHEHLDEIGVIHMNGRIYDPLIGRFMSADPHLQAPDNLQSYNRYAYVMNNPFVYTDPSGFSWWTKIRDNIIKPVVAITVAVYAPEISAAVGLTGTTGVAASVGISDAVASSALAGTVTGAITTGTVKGAVIGGLTGAAFGAVGDIAPSGTGDIATSVGNVVGHALVGCASGAASGGSCGSGAISAAAGSAASNSGMKFDSTAANVVAHAVVGGATSVLGGGKFDSGAATAAAGYLFNELAHQTTMKQRGYESTYYREDGILCNGPGNASCRSPGASGSVSSAANVSTGGEVTGMVGFVGFSYGAGAAVDTNQNICGVQQGCFIVGAGLGLTVQNTYQGSTGGLSTGNVNGVGLTAFGGLGAVGKLSPLQINFDGSASGQVGWGWGGGGGGGIKFCTQVTKC